MEYSKIPSYIAASILQNFESDNGQVRSKQRCFIAHNNDPYLYLRPLKTEIVTQQAIQMYIFHSVLTSAEVQRIKDYFPLMVGAKYFLHIRFHYEMWYIYTENPIKIIIEYIL